MLLAVVFAGEGWIIPGEFSGQGSPHSKDPAHPKDHPHPQGRQSRGVRTNHFCIQSISRDLIDFTDVFLLLQGSGGLRNDLSWIACIQDC